MVKWVRLTGINLVARAGYDRRQGLNISVGFSLEPPFIGVYVTGFRLAAMLGIAVKQESKNQKTLRRLFDHG